MQKPEKILLKFAMMGTLVVFAMASISYIFFDKTAKGDTDQAESAAEQASVLDNEAQPMSTGDAPEFVIDTDQSKIRFSLGEILGGQPVTVIGDTNDFSGTLYFSADAPQAAAIGEIVINARNLQTDNSFRNRAIQGQILNTDSYEFIRFVPTSISGLPETVTLGEAVMFEITGNLTIKDVTREVIFSAQVMPVSETQLDGHAETLIAYADYDIFIPSAPRVADVDDEVLLEIDFVALAQ